MTFTGLLEVIWSYLLRLFNKIGGYRKLFGGKKLGRIQSFDHS